MIPEFKRVSLINRKHRKLGGHEFLASDYKVLYFAEDSECFYLFILTTFWEGGHDEATFTVLTKTIYDVDIREWSPDRESEESAVANSLAQRMLAHSLAPLIAKKGAGNVGIPNSTGRISNADRKVVG